jgi:hypothetical protein
MCQNEFVDPGKRIVISYSPYGIFVPFSAPDSSNTPNPEIQSKYCAFQYWLGTISSGTRVITRGDIGGSVK